MSRPRTSLPAGLAWLLAGFGLWLAGGLAAFAAAPGPAPGEIAIVSATYGVDLHVVDVTARVAGLVQPGADPFVVGAPAFEVKDPAPNSIGKAVEITYNYGTLSKTVTIPDGQILSQVILVEYATGAGVPLPRSAKLLALNEEQLAGVVFIQGDKSLATGFIARVHDTDCVVTNLHVLVENDKFTVKTLAGDLLDTAGIIGAAGVDLALLRLAKPFTRPPPLGLAANVLQTVKIGDYLVVIGNHPDGVATQTGGYVTGFGPDRVEVQAAFQLGNSGSPVFDLVSQQVVGVATFRDPVALDADGFPPRAGDPTLRHWFAVRIDAVSKWENIDSGKWRTQARQVADFHEVSLALLAMYRGALAEARKDLHLRAVIDRFESRLTPSELSQIGVSSYSAEQTREMVREALAYAKDGVDDFAGAEFYDYFRTSSSWTVNVGEQVKFRTQLIKGFTAIDNNLPPYEHRLRP